MKYVYLYRWRKDRIWDQGKTSAHPNFHPGSRRPLHKSFTKTSFPFVKTLVRHFNYFAIKTKLMADSAITLFLHRWIRENGDGPWGNPTNLTAPSPTLRLVSPLASSINPPTTDTRSRGGLVSLHLDSESSSDESCPEDDLTRIAQPRYRSGRQIFDILRILR